MTIEKIEIIEKSPCIVEPRRFKVSAKTDKPLQDVLSILYLALPASSYSKAHGSLSFLRKGKLVGLFSDGRINMSCFEISEEASEHLEELKNLLNKAFNYYKKYGSPDPKLIEIRAKLSPLEIYKYLPKTNCKECGEQGCFPFAVKLSNGEKTLQECPQIQLPKYSINKEQLDKMLQPIKLEG
ncbi:MAG: (Fe-S)-binding protein [Candidatus Bathycorpusculaceae bacterium]